MKKLTIYLASILLALTFALTSASTAKAEDVLTGRIVNKRGMQRLDEALSFGGDDALVGAVSDLTEADEAVIYRSGLSLREILVAHKKSFSDTFTISTTMTSDEMLDKLVSYATLETQKGNEGDYIAYGWNNVSYHVYPTRNSRGSGYVWTVDLEFTYYETAEQEAELARRLPAKNAALGLSGKDTYGKVKAIYDFITSSVTYDDAHVNMGARYPAQFSACAAFLNGIAVCQGYSRLYYRMLKENGVNARCVTSTNHMWNIVFLDGISYCADSTWDAGMKTYQYFLRGLAYFDREHVREAPYDSEAFVNSNRISATDYMPASSTVTPTPVPQPTVVSLSCPKFYVTTLAGRTYLEWNAVTNAREYIVLLWVEGQKDPYTYTTKDTYIYFTKVPEKKVIYYVYPKDYETNGVKYVANKNTMQHFNGYGMNAMAKPKVTKKGLVSWQRSSGSGYEVCYSKSASFKTMKTLTVRSCYQTQLKLFLKKGTYYFSVRPYYTKGGSEYYGTWSEVTKVKIK